MEFWFYIAVTMLVTTALNALIAFGFGFYAFNLAINPPREN